MLGTVRSADGVSVRYETRGRGTPVVLVHGWSCDRSHWRHHLDHFSARHRVVAVDLAGHGDSGRDRTRWTIPRFGDDVVAVLDAFGNEPAVLRALPLLGVPLTAINPGPGPADASLARHGVTAVLLAGVGHFPMLEDPAAFDAALAGVLRQQVTGR